MNHQIPAIEIATAMMGRSTCAVQVGSCVADHWSVFAVGWNHMGYDGYGEHAEVYCLKRANKDRLQGATLYVSAQRMRNRRAVIARPCPECQAIITKHGVKVLWRDNDGEWKRL